MTVSLRSESAMQGKRAVTAAMPRGVCVCMYVCMCVCVHPDSKLRVLAKICWFHLVSDAGGQCMPDSHCPTKTLSAHGEIWPDQPDVPAVFHLGIRLSREPEIRKSRHAFD